MVIAYNPLTPIKPNMTLDAPSPFSTDISPAKALVDEGFVATGNDDPPVFRFEANNSLLPINSGRIFRKAVQAVHCHPASGELSTLIRRVLNALFIHAQDGFRALTDEQRQLTKEWRGTPIFKLQIGRLKSMIEMSGNDHGRVYDAMDNLYRWEFHFNVMADVSGESQIVEKTKSRILSSYSRGEGERQGEISYEIPHDVLMMILEPRPFAQIDMRAVNSLGSTHAIALYENLVRYVGTRNKVTAVMPIEDWTSLISGVGKYPSGAYKNFKRFVLLPAMKWLEKIEAVPFTAELREVKGPRNRVVALQFKLQMKKQASLDMGMPPPTWSPKLLEILAKVYLMNKADIGELAKMATEDELKEAINRDGVMIQRKMAAGETISNRANYLRGILRNLQGGKPKDAEPEPDEEERESKLVQDAMARAGRMRDEFERMQISTIVSRMDSLDDDELRDVRNRFEQSKKDDQTVSQMLKRGWRRGAGGLNSMLAHWISRQPDIVGMFLYKTEEVDFSVWSEIKRAPGKPSKTPS